MRLRLQLWITELRIFLLVPILTDFALLQASKLPITQHFDESFLDDTDSFPHALDVKIIHNNKQILLELERNPYLDLNIPVIALREGAEGEHVHTTIDKDFQPYQDAENFAAITLSCLQGRNSCQPVLEGSYFHEGDMYHIEPIPGHRLLKREIRRGEATHHVYRREHPQTDVADLRPEPVTIQIKPGRTKGRRVRRQTTPTYIVEILLVLDYEIYKRFEQSVPKANRSRDEIYSKLKQYYFQVFNGMDTRYSYINRTDYSIRIRLSNFIIAEEKRYSPWTENYVRNGTIDVTEVLKPFAETKEEIQKKYKLSPFDHAMAMSGYDLIFENKKTTLGYAYLNTTCQYWSVSFVEDRNDIMKTIWTASHELGHSLCALHDGYQNNCKSYKKFIMTSTIDKPSQLTSHNPWKFSSCSVQYFKEMIDKLNRQPLNCLRNTSPPNFFGKPEWKQHLNSHFGTLYNPDEQCQRIHGNNSYMCRHKIQDAGRICTNLWCHRVDPKTGESECTPHLAALGTTCGNKKWCQRGKCVFNQAASPVDECPFGDQPGVLAMGSSCSDTVRQKYDMCSIAEFALQCCESCRSYNNTISVRINRGTIIGPVVDNYIVPEGRVVHPGLPPSPPVLVRSGTSLGAVSLQPVTSSPRRPVLYQAPPIVQQQPEPGLPPSVSPTQTSRPPTIPARGTCQDTGSPFNQSVVGCRGFHTFCYLSRVKRDCCATCRRSQIFPARVVYGVEQTRKKRSVKNLLLSRIRSSRSRINWGLIQAWKRSITKTPTQPLPAETGNSAIPIGTQDPGLSLRTQTVEVNPRVLGSTYNYSPSAGQHERVSLDLGAKTPWAATSPVADRPNSDFQVGPFQRHSATGARPGVTDGSAANHENDQMKVAKDSLSSKLTSAGITRTVPLGYVSKIETHLLPTTLSPQTGSDVMSDDSSLSSVDFSLINIGLFTDPKHEPPAAV